LKTTLQFIDINVAMVNVASMQSGGD